MFQRIEKIEEVVEPGGDYYIITRYRVLQNFAFYRLEENSPSTLFAAETPNLRHTRLHGMHVIIKTGYTVVGVESVEIPNIAKTRSNTFRAYTTDTGVVLLPGPSQEALSPSSYFVDIAGRYCTAWTLPGTHERHNAKFLDAEQLDAFDAGIFLLQLRTHPDAIYTPLKTLEGFTRTLTVPKPDHLPDWMEEDIASRKEEMMGSPSRRTRRRITPPVVPMHVGPVPVAPAPVVPTAVVPTAVVPAPVLPAFVGTTVAAESKIAGPDIAEPVDIGPPVAALLTNTDPIVPASV